MAPEVQKGHIKDFTSSDFAILMCVFNGEKYLSQQLESIFYQTDHSWQLFVSDDGSIDHTRSIVVAFQEKVGKERVQMFRGPEAGFSKNFFSLLMNPSIRARYYALCDQDDIWDKNKLAVARRIFEQNDPLKPMLYCGNTIIVDENDVPIGYYKNSPFYISFKNALVQNIASGNTMVINSAARNIFLKINRPIDVYAHDWFVYQLVSGVGGHVFYDKNPYVRYRQHSSNQIGVKLSWRHMLTRLYRVFSGEFSDWNDRNVKGLTLYIEMLQESDAQILDFFSKARKSYGPKAIYLLSKSGVRRQKLYQNIALYVAAFMGRI